MQTLSSGRPNSLSSQSRRVAIFAVLLFALAGLISGFAVGGFVRPKIGGIGNTGGNNINNPIVQQTKTATPVPQPRPQTIRVETVDGFTSPEEANGTTYTLTARLRPVLGADHQPVKATDLTCKLWLIDRVPGGQGVYISSDIARNVAGLNDSFTIQGGTLDGQEPLPSITYSEIPQSLNFNSDTPQTHSCATQGEVTWRYQVSPSVPPGKYTLVVFYDWSGKHWTWYFVDISIKQANQS